MPVARIGTPGVSESNTHDFGSTPSGSDRVLIACVGDRPGGTLTASFGGQSMDSEVNESSCEAGSPVNQSVQIELFSLDEAGIAAASTDIITGSSGANIVGGEFFENVDQVAPIPETLSASACGSATSNGDPFSSGNITLATDNAAFSFAMLYDWYGTAGSTATVGAGDGTEQFDGQDSQFLTYLGQDRLENSGQARSFEFDVSLTGSNLYPTAIAVVEIAAVAAAGMARIGHRLIGGQHMRLIA